MDQILIVEDSEEFQLVIRRALEGPNLGVSMADSLKSVEGLVKLKGAAYQLVILDLALPDGDGFAVLNVLRRAGLPKETPVLFLTSETAVQSKLKAFELGADDYLVKPISPIELLARVQARLRKAGIPRRDMIMRGQLLIELSSLRAFRLDGEKKVELSLTGKEFKLLAFMAHTENKIFSRRELVDSIWGVDLHILDRTVDSHVYGLRKKMGQLSTYIECVPQLGYRFKLPQASLATS